MYHCKPYFLWRALWISFEFKEFSMILAFKYVYYWWYNLINKTDFVDAFNDDAKKSWILWLCMTDFDKPWQILLSCFLLVSLLLPLYKCAISMKLLFHQIHKRIRGPWFYILVLKYQQKTKLNSFLFYKFVIPRDTFWYIYIYKTWFLII